MLRGAGVLEPAVYHLPSSVKCDCELVANISTVISNASKKRSHLQVGGKHASGWKTCKLVENMQVDGKHAGGGRIIGPDTVCFETAR